MGVQLTRKEREAVQLVADGLSNKAIARRVGRSERTIEAHLSNAYAKLGVHDRDSAAAVLSSYLEGKSSVGGSTEPPPSNPGPATAEPHNGTERDYRPWLARHWRPPPQSRLVVFGLILASALIIAIILAAIIGNVEVIMRGIERLSRLSSGEPQ